MKSSAAVFFSCFSLTLLRQVTGAALPSNSSLLGDHRTAASISFHIGQTQIPPSTSNAVLKPDTTGVRQFLARTPLMACLGLTIHRSLTLPWKGRETLLVSHFPPRLYHL